MEQVYVDEPVTFRSNRNIHVSENAILVKAELDTAVDQLAWDGSVAMNIAGLQPMCTLPRYDDEGDSQSVLLSPVDVTLRYFILDANGSELFSELETHHLVLPTRPLSYAKIYFSKTAVRQAIGTLGPIIVGVQVTRVTDICANPLTLSNPQSIMTVSWRREADYICLTCPNGEPEPPLEGLSVKRKLAEKKSVRKVTKGLKNTRLK